MLQLLDSASENEKDDVFYRCRSISKANVGVAVTGNIGS